MLTCNTEVLILSSSYSKGKRRIEKIFRDIISNTCKYDVYEKKFPVPPIHFLRNFN